MRRPEMEERDKAVLRLLALGYSFKEIAQEVRVRDDHVSRLTSLIYARLGASNAPSAVAIAIAKGLIENPYDASGNQIVRRAA